MSLKVGCCFSGIGGLELGFEDAGCEIVFQVEIDPACQRTLKKHWPDTQLYDDITEVTYERLHADLGRRADVDVLVGGWPCQDISLAGRRAGLAGERSGLFFEFARLAKEIAPRWLVAENVPGLLSSWSPVEPTPSEVQAGRDWEVDETHDLGVVISTLAELGYVGAWRCLDAQHFGVPQRRRRIFFVCHLGAPFTAPAEVLLERDCSVGDLAESEEAWEDDAEAVGSGADEAGELGGGEIVSALTSAHGGPDDNMAQAGHLVPQALGVGSDSSSDVAGTLGATSNGRGWNSDLDRMGALVIDKPVFVGSDFGEDVARPLLAVPNGQRFDMESENLLIEPVAYTVHSANSTAMTGGGDAEAAFETETARSLDTTGGLATNQGGTVVVEPEPPFAVSMRGRDEGNVPEVEHDGVVPALRTGQGGSGNPMVVTDSSESEETVYTVHNGDDAIWSKDIAQPVIATKGFPGAVTFRKSRRAHTEDDNETWEQDEVANTLNGYENHNDIRTTHAIVEPVPVELRMATRTSGQTGVGTPGTGFGDEGDPSYPVMASPPPPCSKSFPSGVSRPSNASGCRASRTAGPKARSTPPATSSSATPSLCRAPGGSLCASST
jgi:site-specific DNA-cytosine methylase